MPGRDLGEMLTRFFVDQRNHREVENVGVKQAKSKSPETWSPSKSKEGRKWMFIQVKGQQPGCQGAGGVAQTMRPGANPETRRRKGRLTPKISVWQVGAQGLAGCSPRLQLEAARLCLDSSPWLPTRNWELCAFSANTAAVAAATQSVCVQVCVQALTGEESDILG